MKDTWRQRSRDVIGEAWLAWVDIHGEKPSREMPDSEKERFLKYVNQHYPFGQRDMYPYTVWLSEMKKMKDWIYSEPDKIDTGLFGKQDTYNGGAWAGK